MSVSSFDLPDFTSSDNKPVPKTVAPPSVIKPPVPGVTPPVAKGAPPAPMPTMSSDQLIDSRNFNKINQATTKDIPSLQTDEMNLVDESARLKELALNDQQKNLVNSEENRTRLYEYINKEQKTLTQKHQNDLKEADAFAPSKESAAELAQMFGLMTIATFGSGGMGKYHGLATLSAMSGLSQGFKEGKKERFNQEKAAYEENLKALESHNAKVEKTFNDAMNLLSKNKELGEQKIKELIALDNSGPIAANARAGRFDQVASFIDNVKKSLEKLKEIEQKRKDDFALLGQKFNNDKELQRLKFENDKALQEAKIAGEKDVAKIKAEMKIQADDVVSDLAKRGIHIADKKDRGAVESTVNAMSNLQELKNQVVQDPTLVGRQGQIRQFTDRYFQSFKGGPAVDESGVKPEDQAALRFAKKYASMLTRYEQALAGTARAGSTVFFQKRYNDLLSANQFNPAGMVKLMEDMEYEIAREAIPKSPKLTMGILQEMATEFQGRVGNIETTPSKPRGTGTADNPIKLD